MTISQETCYCIGTIGLRHQRTIDRSSFQDKNRSGFIVRFSSGDIVSMKQLEWKLSIIKWLLPLLVLIISGSILYTVVQAVQEIKLEKARTKASGLLPAAS